MTEPPKTFSKIVVNGQEVDLNNVPDFLKRFVQDADGNGIPDFLDQLFNNPLFKMVAGKSIDQMKAQLANAKNLTPEQRQKIQNLFEKLGGSGSVATAASSPVTVTTVTTGSSFQPAAASKPIDYRSLGIPDPEQKSFSAWPIVGALAALLLAAAAWYLMKP